LTRHEIGDFEARGKAARNFLKTIQFAAITPTTIRPLIIPTRVNASPNRSPAPDAVGFSPRITAAIKASVANTANGATEKATHRNLVFMGTQDDAKIRRVPPRYMKTATRAAKITIRMTIKTGGSSKDMRRLTFELSR
jgi:hypothetical protein